MASIPLPSSIPYGARRILGEDVSQDVSQLETTTEWVKPMVSRVLTGSAALSDGMIWPKASGAKASGAKPGRDHLLSRHERMNLAWGVTVGANNRFSDF